MGAAFPAMRRNANLARRLEEVFAPILAARTGCLQPAASVSSSRLRHLKNIPEAGSDPPDTSKAAPGIDSRHSGVSMVVMKIQSDLLDVSKAIMKIYSDLLDVLKATRK